MHENISADVHNRCVSSLYSLEEPNLKTMLLDYTEPLEKKKAQYWCKSIAFVRNVGIFKKTQLLSYY